MAPENPDMHRLIVIWLVHCPPLLGFLAFIEATRAQGVLGPIPADQFQDCSKQSRLKDSSWKPCTGHNFQQHSKAPDVIKVARPPGNKEAGTTDRELMTLHASAVEVVNHIVFATEGSHWRVLTQLILILLVGGKRGETTSAKVVVRFRAVPSIVDTQLLISSKLPGELTTKKSGIVQMNCPGSQHGEETVQG